jgi:hypothetical protein
MVWVAVPAELWIGSASDPFRAHHPHTHPHPCSSGRQSRNTIHSTSSLQAMVPLRGGFHNSRGPPRPPKIERDQVSLERSFLPNHRFVPFKADPATLNAQVCPFLVRVFINFGGNHPTSDFGTDRVPDRDEYQLYTW